MVISEPFTFRFCRKYSVAKLAAIISEQFSFFFYLSTTGVNSRVSFTTRRSVCGDTKVIFADELQREKGYVGTTFHSEPVYRSFIRQQR